MFKKSNHKSGYAYAINIDPAMYMTYVGPVSKEAWNNHLKHIGLNLKYPQVAVIPKGHDWSNHLLVYVVSKKKH